MAHNNKKEPLFHIVKRDDLSAAKTWGIRGIGILAGFIFICIMSAIELKISPFKVIGDMFSGAFGSGFLTLVTLRSAAVFIILAMALAPAFRMKFWNIGAEGQALVAGLACAACMFKLGGKIPDGWLIFISLVASLAAGIAWAVIPAIFKAFWNTNETLFTLMMNYVATQLVLYCVKVWVTNGSGTLPPMADGNLPQIGGGDYWLGIIFSIVLTAAMYLYLRFSKHGYEISVVGESVKTAKYIGVNVKKVIIRTLILSGAICGMAGFLIVAGMDHTITSTTINGRGFTAVLIAWLAHLNPIAIAGMSLLVAFLSRGTKELMTRAQITNDFYAQVITGIMFFIILACDFFIRYKIVFKKKRNSENEGSDAQKGKDELSETTTAAVKEGN